jgi:hypothetical protein
MRFTVFVLLILSSIIDVSAALACGIHMQSSSEMLRNIAQSYEAPATKEPVRAMVSGGKFVVITHDKGEKVTIDENLVLQPGMKIYSRSGRSQISLPTTGQTIELAEGAVIQVVALNKSADEKICSVSFEMQSGRASFSSNHIAREKDCKRSQPETFEVVTSNVGITPVGTKYNVDLNQAIAELNGETNTNAEEVSVDKGSVKIRIVKLKKTRQVAKEENVAASDYVFDDQKPVTIKAGRKAKIKKGKKDRLADIQIVYPD